MSRQISNSWLHVFFLSRLPSCSSRHFDLFFFFLKVSLPFLSPRARSFFPLCLFLVQLLLVTGDGGLLRKAGPRAQVVIRHRSAALLPDCLLLSFPCPVKSYDLNPPTPTPLCTSPFLFLLSSSLFVSLSKWITAPWRENTTPYQSFSLPNKHKGSRGV